MIDKRFVVYIGNGTAKLWLNTNASCYMAAWHEEHERNSCFYSLNTFAMPSGVYVGSQNFSTFGEMWAHIKRTDCT